MCADVFLLPPSALWLPAPETEWQQCRDEIYETIMKKGRNAFALIPSAYNLHQALNRDEGREWEDVKVENGKI